MHRHLRAIAWMLAPMLGAGAQGVAGVPAYEARGRAVELHRAVMQARLERLRASVLDTLRAAAPDLVSRLDPAPPPVQRGYQLLPRLVADAPQPADTGRRASLYSWPWTDSLITRGLGRLDGVDRILARPSKRRADYDALVAEFNGVAADRRLIDAHVEHNWFWQRAIAADTSRFLRASRMIDSAFRGAPVAVPAGTIPVAAMALQDSGQRPATIRVPVVTDIEDTAFVLAAVAVIERSWSSSDFQVRVDVRFMSARALYCPGQAASCAPPVRGAAIDLPAHVARFPAQLAVLTTGGSQPHVLGGRAMILGPRDLTGRTLGHEFGHILGFDDAYLRGYRNLGGDGFAIIELIPDRTDLMASSGVGASQPRHFMQLVANLRADRAMRAGLAAMYDQRDPRAAIPLFREALASLPGHYGATFQLAKALDQSGDSAAAVPVWRRVLELSRAQGDSATAAAVRARLGIP